MKYCLFPCIPCPTGCSSPRMPNGASAFSRPRRIFSSLGKGGKNSGGGGIPGMDMSGIFGGADEKALILWAYCRSSGYGKETTNQRERDAYLSHILHIPSLAFLIALKRVSPSSMISSSSTLPFSNADHTSLRFASNSSISASRVSIRCWFR